jgi:hypothetical protein
MKFSPLPCYFIPLRPKYSPQHPQPTFLPHYQFIELPRLYMFRSHL